MLFEATKHGMFSDEKIVCEYPTIMALIDSIFIKIKNSLYNVSIPKSIVMNYKKIVFLIFPCSSQF